MDIPAAGSVGYYRRVQQRMGGGAKTAEFPRLFLVPGVDHGFRVAGVSPVGLHEALFRWVEEGQAPEKLLAEKPNASGKVIRTRPLFPYPRAAKYKGSGTPDKAENFISHTPSH